MAEMILSHIVWSSHHGSELSTVEAVSYDLYMDHALRVLQARNDDDIDE